MQLTYIRRTRSAVVGHAATIRDIRTSCYDNGLIIVWLCQRQTTTSANLYETLHSGALQ